MKHTLSGLGLLLLVLLVIIARVLLLIVLLVVIAAVLGFRSSLGSSLLLFVTGVLLRVVV